MPNVRSPRTRRWGRRLGACLGVWLLAGMGGCEELTPDEPETGTQERSPKPADAEKTLREHLHGAGLRWVVPAGGDWEVVPSDDARHRWDRLEATLEADGYTLRRDGAVRVVSRGGHTEERLRPPDAGWLVLVLDDIGFHPQRVRRVLEWDVPTVFAVLPGRPHSRALAKLIDRRGRDLLLHQPMEPRGYPQLNPGKHALLMSQSPRRWRQILEDNLEAVPEAVGVNNHMGSRFTADAQAAEVVTEWLKRRGLMFLDSLTTQGSQMRRACAGAGVPYAARHVFLDHERTPEFVDRQIERWLRRAGEAGVGIAIGHPYRVTLDRLASQLPRIRDAGYRFVGAGHLRALAEAGETDA